MRCELPEKLRAIMHCPAGWSRLYTRQSSFPGSTAQNRPTTSAGEALRYQISLRYKLNMDVGSSFCTATLRTVKSAETGSQGFLDEKPAFGLLFHCIGVRPTSRLYSAHRRRPWGSWRNSVGMTPSIIPSSSP